MITYNQLVYGSRRCVKRHKVRSTALKGCPQKRGMCIRVTVMKPKKPNSAIRKIAKVRLSTRRRITAYICGIGHSLQEYSVVLVRGGRIPDLPGVRYKLIRGKFDFNWREKKERCHARSKYGIPRNHKTIRMMESTSL